MGITDQDGDRHSFCRASIEVQAVRLGRYWTVDIGDDYYHVYPKAIYTKEAKAKEVRDLVIAAAKDREQESITLPK